MTELKKCDGMPLSIKVRCFPSLEGSQCTLLTHGGVRGSMGEVQIMENEFEGRADRKGLGGFFSEEFVKKISFVRLQSRFP